MALNLMESGMTVWCTEMANMASFRYWNNLTSKANRLIRNSFFAIYSWPDGPKYDGSWIKNKMEGICSLFDKMRKVREKIRENIIKVITEVQLCKISYL